ncbi:hypothetical protein G6F52_004462 [Rhizopus delemar]|nr:hypothetical protein G6F52_004462 [Rhizopus delemar]
MGLYQELAFFENIECEIQQQEETTTEVPENTAASKQSKRKAPAKNKPKKKTRKAKDIDSEDEYEIYDSEEENESDDSEEEEENGNSKPENTIHFDKKQDLKLIDNAREMNYNDISAYGSSLYVVATTKLQNEQLYIGVPPGTTLSSNLIVILKQVVRSRHKGIYQADVSKNYGIDGRSAGHICKSLEERGCIIRKSVSLKGARTNLCIHVRFASQDKTVDMSKATEDRAFYNVNANNEAFTQKQLRDAMIELIKDAPGHAILAKDALEALGFNHDSKSVKSWFNRSLDELCLKGYFKKSDVKLDNKGRYYRCIHLLKLPEEYESKQVEAIIEDIVYPIHIKSTKKDIPLLHILHDVPIEQQLYQVIEAAGTQGVISKEISFALNLDEHRLLYKLLERMLENNEQQNGHYTIRRHFEFEGRSRRYRYFTYNSYIKVYENKEPTYFSLPEIPVDISECVEINPLEKLSLDKKKRGSKKKPVKLRESTKSKKMAQKEQEKKQVAVELHQPSEMTSISEVTYGLEPVEMEISHMDDESVPIENQQTERIREGQQDMPTVAANTAKKQRQMGIKDFFGASKKRKETMPANPPPETKKAKTQTEDDMDEVSSDSSLGEMSPVIVISKSPILKERSLLSKSTSTTPFSNPLTPSKSSEQVKKPKRSTAVVELPTVNGNSLKTFTHSKAGVNKYMEHRINILREFLAEKPLIEINKQFKDECQKKLQEISGNSNHTLDLKTLQRGINTLVQRGEIEAETVQCKLLNGTIFDKKIIIRKDVKKDGAEYKAFIEHLQDRHTLQRVGNPSPHYERISIPVERLDQRLARMKESLQKLVGQGETGKAAALKKQIEKLSDNYEKCRSKDDKFKSNNWMITAIQYGWIFARMVRTRLLHEFLFDLLLRADALNGGIDKEENTITSACIVSNMSLELVCQVIGIINPNDSIEEYFRTTKDLSIKFSELPADIRSSIFLKESRFRRKLRNLLVTLEYLGLLTRRHNKLDEDNPYIDTRNSAALASQYVVHKHVQIRDMRTVDYPIYRDFTLESKSDVLDYWNSLEYLYRTPTDITKYQLAPRPKNPIESEIYSILLNPKSWNMPGIYSKPQRRILNSYIDKSNHSTPLDNDRVIQEIAMDINCPIFMVRNYYKKMEEAFNKKNEIKKKRRLQSALLSKRTRGSGTKVDMLDGRRVLRLDSRNLFKRTKLGPKTISNKFISDKNASKASNENKAAFMDDLSHLPVVLNEVDSAIINTRVSKRFTWEQEEEELLTYSAAILKYRGRKSRFRWAAITQVINRSQENCRRRYSNLLKVFGYEEKLAKLIAMWETIYKKGIMNGEITDPNPYEMVDFDLLGHLAYFIEKMKTHGRELESKDDLPKSTDEVFAHFNVVQTGKARDFYFEDGFHKFKTMTAKMTILKKEALCTRRCRDTELDVPPFVLKEDINKVVRQKYNYRSVALMSLLTPSERFNPYYVFLIIRRFPESIVEDAIRMLVDSKTLIKAPKYDRVIPGTRNALSSKFTTELAGGLPQDLYTQAKEYDKFLNEQNEQILLQGEFISSGMMACMLSLASQGMLSVELNEKNMFLEKAVMPIKRVRMMCAESVQFDIKHGKTLEQIDSTTTPLVSDSVPIGQLSVESFEILFDTLLASTDKPELLKNVVEKLKKSTESGLVPHELKEALDIQCTDEDIYNALHTLMNCSPPLLYRVGHLSVRYVLAPFMNEWLIDTKVATSEAEIVKMEEEYVNKNNVVVPEKKRFILPALWTDINGCTTPALVESFCKALADIVLRMPGITISGIERHHKSSLTKKEVHDIMEILIKQRVIRGVKVILDKYEKPSVFSKTRTMRCTQKMFTIAAFTQTCYWVNDDYYRKLN